MRGWLKKLSGGDEERLAELELAMRGIVKAEYIEAERTLIAKAYEKYGVNCDYEDAVQLFRGPCEGECEGCAGLRRVAEYYNSEETEEGRGRTSLSGEVFVRFRVEKCERRLKAEAEAEYRRRLRRSGLPEGLLRVPLPERLKGIYESIIAGERWYWLRGRVGVGKTLVMVKAGSELVRRGVEVVYKGMSELSSELRGSGSESVMERMRGAEVLMIDDVGSEYSSEWVRAKVYEVVDGRYGRGRTTHFTSNEGIRDLAEWGIQGMRTGDRILALGKEVEIR